MATTYSIIIPAYNAAAFLARLLESLRAQTRPPLEIIVVDDASTDDTAALAGEFGVRYERLGENRGPAAARNRGAELAQGEWLVFADADTVFQPDTLEVVDAVLESVEMDALVGTYAGRPANDGFAPLYKGLWELATIEMRLARRGVDAVPITTWAPRPGVVRRAAFESIGGFDTGFRGADLEDMDLGYRLAAAGYRIYFSPRVRIAHHYPDSLWKELRPFARRAALWMRMRSRYPRLDTGGEGSPRQAVAHLAGFGAAGALAGGAFWPPLLAAAGALCIAYAALNWDFLAVCRREAGIAFALAAFAICWLHTLVLGAAAAYGLLTMHRGRA
ncbi:MAG: glycosyltransferase family 2 protein [Candidatus Hydrogenedentes bacterium]|nr:glycosyltransferase family 2 protein [Candidatus Hydrogenedentota bacterium]